MSYLNQQAQLFLAAALLMVVACALLYVAFAFYAFALDKFFRLIGLHGAFCEFILKRENRKKWWFRVANTVDTLKERD